MKHIEIKTITHNNIGITVKINYDKQEISIVERKQKSGLSVHTWQDKHFIFSGRSIGYVKGWGNILDAIKNAMETAHKELKEFVDKKEKENLKRLKELQLVEKFEVKEEDPIDDDF